MSNRVVIKFGGADLSTGERIKEAAQIVAESDFREKVVVVSAMGKTTDELTKTIIQVKTEAEDYADIISMGERTSARIFSSALKAYGIKAVYIDPSLEHFPIVTDSNFINAEPNFKKTKEKVKKYLEPLLGEVVPVVCGFLGQDENGRITTLGRGGSDTTATLLAACLDANEIILVKDVKGIYSVDPEIVPEAKALKTLDIYEMFALAQGGAKVIKAEALRYKLPNQKLVIVDFSSKDLRKVATEIIGDFNPTNAKLQHYDNLSAITLIGEITSLNIQKLFSSINGEPLAGISTGKNCITVFGNYLNPKDIIRKLHALNSFKAITCKENICMIELIHPTFVFSPGWVAKIACRLALKGINLIEVTTGKATINLFIEQQSKNHAIEILGDILEI